jgi:HK97 gp10 family phage protein
MPGRGPKVSFQWAGVPQLMNCLQQAGISIDDKKPEIKQVIMPPAQAMIANAQNLAPIGKKKYGKFEPGNLRKSLIATPGPATQRGVFMVARKRIAPYAVYVEMGTSKMAPRPFFRPALLQMGNTYANDIAPGVKTILEAAATASAYHSASNEP